MASDLTRIGEKAKQEPELVFTSLYHHVTRRENLAACFQRMEPGKAPGVDGVTKEQYGQELESNLQDLEARLKRLGYRAQAVRRKWIPKPGSTKKRPLGIPCFEDQLVEMALKQVMEPIWEVDFLDCSYGYRPGRTAHQALDRLGKILQQKRINWVVEVDIRSFFDRVNQILLMKCLKQRIGDRRILRLVWRILKSGVMEDGLTQPSEDGTPQGGVLSPLLSNIYLHYALDQWFALTFQPKCRGEAHLFRFADDFVVCFQYRWEAEQFLRELKERLGQFHLETEDSKTKLVEFGRFAEPNARQRGKKPESFDFLGLTHYCGKTRYGVFKVKRKTSAKKFRAKLAEFTKWIREHRMKLRTGELLKRAKVRLRGHLQYYAITDNSAMCDSYRYQLTRLLFKWLNRRSQRKSYTWKRFLGALGWVKWPSVRILHRLDPFGKSA
ncbi:MAG: group II intron reverse transcriptase/maturase [Acidobacteria bacterium]|nr:MAG: group II intron reverse transcriptase/maturase [Acidobacteriota bacterium]